jgi:hypothetical protein
MIYDIKRNIEKMEWFVKNTDSGPSDRQSLESGEYPEVEGAFYFSRNPSFSVIWRYLYPTYAGLQTFYYIGEMRWPGQKVMHFFFCQKPHLVDQGH